jgi:hypothetical protein
MFFDPMYWLLVFLPGLAIGIWAQVKLWHAYGKYNKVPVDSGMTGAQAAREILNHAGLNDMPVEEIPGHLTDHYDPTKRALFLSSENFPRPDRRGGGRGGARSRSRAPASGGLRIVQRADDAGAGHAIREHGLHGHLASRHVHGPDENGPVDHHRDVFGDHAVSSWSRCRWNTTPAAAPRNNCSGSASCMKARARGVSKVLDAAALTYVAALVSSILTLLYYITLARDSRR